MSAVLGALTLAGIYLAVFGIPGGAVAWALSSPLQRYADRLRPPPDDANPLVAVTIAALVPSSVFGAGSALVLVLFFPPKPSILMTEWMFGAVIVFGILIGMIGNVLVSATRTYRWSLARRTALSRAQRRGWRSS